MKIFNIRMNDPDSKENFLKYYFDNKNLKNFIKNYVDTKENTNNEILKDFLKIDSLEDQKSLKYNFQTLTDVFNFLKKKWKDSINPKYTDIMQKQLINIKENLIIMSLKQIIKSELYNNFNFNFDLDALRKHYNFDFDEQIPIATIIKKINLGELEELENKLYYALKESNKEEQTKIKNQIETIKVLKIIISIIEAITTSNLSYSTDSEKIISLFKIMGDNDFKFNEHVRPDINTYTSYIY